MIIRQLFPVLALCCCLSSCIKKEVYRPIEKTRNLANRENVIANFKYGAFIKIACEGTSLTYGEDYQGTDTVSASLPNGPTRAINQYPAVMRQALNDPQFTLSVRGYPGDRTTEALTRWQDSIYTNICILEYGTNDAYNYANYASGKVPVAVFKAQLTQLVQRRVDQGAWVILCLPPYLSNGDRSLTRYREAAQAVAANFYVPVFDVEQSIKSIPSPYSDPVHLNAVGYAKWGKDMASFISLGMGGN